MVRRVQGALGRHARRALTSTQRLKTVFADSTELADASKDLIMINLEDDEGDAAGAAYQPDGGYIPRILFAPNGELDVCTRIA